MARPAPAPAPRVTAFYARVTSEESVRKDLSLPNQRARFDEIARGSGWETEAFVEDAAVSGELGPSHRPALRALLASLRAGRIDRVVVRHLDRLGRGTVLEEIIAVLRDQGVELWTFDGRQDIRSAAGRLGVRAQAMVGAFEVERTGERVREMKRQKARAGYYIGPTGSRSGATKAAGACGRAPRGTRCTRSGESSAAPTVTPPSRDRGASPAGTPTTPALGGVSTDPTRRWAGATRPRCTSTSPRGRSATS